MAVWLNITMDEVLYARLKKEVRPKGISAFINELVRTKPRPDRQKLDVAYPGRQQRAMAEATGGRLEPDRCRGMAGMSRGPRSGDIYWVALDPVVGTKIKKTRPAVIVSNESCNAHGNRVAVLR